MVEHIGENNFYEWYDIIRDYTPKQAVEDYIEDMGLEGEKAVPNKHGDACDGEYLSTSADVRAYYIMI